MTIRIRLQSVILALALVMLPLLGCNFTSNDKGDDPGAGKSTKADVSQTGGLGEKRGNDLPRPGETAPRGSN
jgi:hypothetical protein